MGQDTENAGTIGRYLGVSELVSVLGVSRSTLTRERSDGAFPPHTKIRGRKVWPEDAVRAYLASRSTGGSVTHAVTHNSPSPTSPALRRGDYQTALNGMVIEVGEMTAKAAGEFNALLVKLGFPGVTVLLMNGLLIITWPDALGYSEDMIERKVGKAVRRGARVETT